MTRRSPFVALCAVAQYCRTEIKRPPLTKMKSSGEKSVSEMIATGGPAFEASIMVLGDRGNRDPHRLLAGRRSAALLSLERGVPVVPVGIRFPRAEPNRPIRDHDLMEVHIGPLLRPPPRAAPRLRRAALHDWHAAVMSEIARLSGKSWTPDTEGRHELSQPPFSAARRR